MTADRAGLPDNAFTKHEERYELARARANHASRLGALTSDPRAMIEAEMGSTRLKRFWVRSAWRSRALPLLCHCLATEPKRPGAALRPPGDALKAVVAG